MPQIQLNDAEFPDKVRFLFEPARYKVLYGGRAGIKSWSMARALLIIAAGQPKRVLCAREQQNSVQESVHQLLESQISTLGLDPWFDVQQGVILGKNGSEFIFAGIKSNPTKIKSMEGIDICWVEEAEKVSARSWSILVPTIRKAGSEIWVSFNPDEETDPTSQKFLVNPPPGCAPVETSWRDNPWFSDELRREMEYDKRVDPEAAAHTWEGKFRRSGKEEVFHGKWTVEAFTPVTEQDDPFTLWRGPYLGADWGFSQDPTTLIKMWVRERVLYIEHESYHVGMESDRIADVWRKDVPGIDDDVIRADNSRPETINHVAKNGNLRVESAEKWPGSVEDGIKFLRSFEQIVIHPRCKHTEREAKLYRYKVDQLTGDVLKAIVDRHNHCWDAIRYGLQPMIRSRRSIYEVL